MGSVVEISVVMGVYNPGNQERFYRAVKSVIQQTFQNWEMILYDDGSDETGRQVIEWAAALDDRIILIRSDENRGLAHALNYCIRQAKGRYIARMDDDDISRKDRLERQYSFLELHPRYHWAGSNAELIDSRGIWGVRKVPEIPGKKDFLFTSPYIHPSVMFHKKVLMENRGYRTSGKFMLCEDYELFMRLHRNGYQGYNIQETLIQYREDYDAHKRRTYRRRIREMRLRYEGFKQLGILNKITFYHVFRPLMAGAVPAWLRHCIKKQMKGWKIWEKKEKTSTENV
ncbi:MAG: glycosyltransferase [Ruminococcus sp.]|jgi:glycosyltransferase EpsE